MPKLTSFLLLASLAALGASCGGSDNYASHEVAVTVVEGWWPNLDLDETYVLRSDSEWEAVWNLHGQRTSPKPVRAPVNFDNNMILGLTKGTSSGCSSLAIVRVIEEEAAVRVEYIFSESKTTGATFCAGSLTPLTSFVEAPRIDKDVYFKRTDA